MKGECKDTEAVMRVKHRQANFGFYDKTKRIIII